VELISQHAKAIMEGCKKRACDAGLKFQTETLEYIVTNKDLIDLGPKNMIPTLYDYWVHDVELLKDKGTYELFPYNPYETVINTRPAISFYNDNNPDWLNVAIFYHVLAHIDFFQNNLFYRHTWDEDFTGQALSDKRTIAMLHAEKGRWVDYVIEFARGIDNLVDYYSLMSEINRPETLKSTKRLDYYFDVFLQTIKKVSLTEYLKELDRYNDTVSQYGTGAESIFFAKVTKSYPEFAAMFEKKKKTERETRRDIIRFVEDHSSFLRKEENKWMTTVMEIVRKTSLYFQPQIRTKIMNEGWASYWHERLFLRDDRIKGNEIGYARVNAKITSLPRVGLNPYALGLRLFSYIEDMADKGRLSFDFQRLANINARETFDTKTGNGLDTLFWIRENMNDFMFINTFVDQDFVNKHKIFVAERRPNMEKGVWEYYIKSRNAEAYRKMLLDSLYHPPSIRVDEEKSQEGVLYLNHRFEGKQLVQEYIPNTMLGIEYLWGAPVKLETTEFVADGQPDAAEGSYYSGAGEKDHEQTYRARRVLYKMEKKELSKMLL